MDCMFMKFADDTELEGAIDTPEGRAATQRDLDKLEEWVIRNLMTFCEDKCQVQHLGRKSPLQQHRQGTERLASSSAGKDLKGVGEHQAGREPAVCLCSKGSQLHPGLYDQKHRQQIEGSDCPLFLDTC